MRPPAATGLSVIFIIVIGHTGAGCQRDHVTIETGSGRHEFSVEIAGDFVSRARGLMYRPLLSAGSGMLFVYDRETPVSFWMKNVTFPLDMIFIDSNAIIVGIQEDAQPGDERPVHSGVAVRGVLEIAGGASRRARIKPGDRVLHPIFQAHDRDCGSGYANKDE